MSEEKRRFKATIAGRSYTIIGTRPDEHMKVVAETVNEQLKQISNMSKDLDPERRAILMAINAVSDQLNMQQEMMKMEKKIKELERKAGTSHRLDGESQEKG